MNEVIKAINFGASKETIFNLLNKNNIKFEYKRISPMHPNNELIFNNKVFKNI